MDSPNPPAGTPSPQAGAAPAPEPSATLPVRWRTEAVALLACVGLWLVCRPYRGVRHDGLFYVGQVLNHLFPARFANDVFFMFGSQDRYSIFTPLMTPWIRHFGVSTAVLAALVICQAAFAWACWSLTEGWLSRPLRWAAVAAAIVLPHTYGGLGAFSYAEPFLTARSFAEPLALFALSALLRGRLARAILLALVATAFHPLITLPVLLLGWTWLILGDRRWAWLALLPVAAAVAGAAGLAPLDGLWHRFDADWRAGVDQYNANAFLASYSTLDWVPVLFDLLVVGLLARQPPSPVLGRLAKALLWVVPATTVAWALGADVSHNVLLTQVQLWRVFFPLHLVAVMGLPWLLHELWGRGVVGRWAAATLALAGLAAMSNWPTGWLCLAWAVAALLALRFRVKLSPIIGLLAVGASAAAAVTISVRVTRVTMRAIQMAPDRFDQAGRLLVVLGLPLTASVLGALLLWASVRRGAWPWLAAAASLCLCAYGSGVWDQRSPWQRLLEDGGGAAGAPFASVLPDRASVFWQGGLEDAWLLARRGDFFNDEQSAGLLFNRGTALEFVRRHDATGPMELQINLCEDLPVLTGQPLGNGGCVTESVFDQTCDATPHPDYIVLSTPVDRPMIARWTSPAGIAPARSLYLYRCPVRRSPRPPASPAS